MKIFIAVISFLFAVPTSENPEPVQDIDSSEDEKKVMAAVVAWADSVFYQHTEYKFEHFRAEYTDEYYIMVMRANMYKKRVDDLEKKKAAGLYTKTEPEYTKELSDLKTAWSGAQKEADNFPQRASYYRVHFWSNIFTNDGITVYYEHIMRVDNDYRIVEAVENSAIGKKSAETKILYKKDVKGDGNR
jgi:hypothetical protein